jgi:hypothetical protein
MRTKLLRSYRSSKGNTVFVYTVTGSPAQLDAFKAAQGDNYREEETTKQALWFTTRCVGQAGELIITSKGKVVPDMSKFEQAASLAAQFGGNLGQELAKHAAATLLGAPVAEAVTAPAANAPANIGGM